ncbi:MAG: CRISPR-associated endonuclease Cas2 [Thermoanaerobaculia bacterium]|nr:CRISPR-associated endonuclease Cas2 [Thermoanaerobaculia bacterium]
MPTLICYDIESNALRTRLGQKILEFGLERINLSVYLGTLKSADLAKLEKLLHDLMKAKAGPDDSLIILAVTAAQVAQMQVLGRNDLDLDDLTGDRHTLIL